MLSLLNPTIVFMSILGYGLSSPMALREKKDTESVPSFTVGGVTLAGDMNNIIKATPDSIAPGVSVAETDATEPDSGSINCWNVNLTGGCVNGRVPKNACAYTGDGKPIKSVSPFVRSICLYFTNNDCYLPKKGEAFWIEGPGIVGDVSQYIGDKKIMHMICTTKN